MTAMVNKLEREGKGAVLLCCDVKKCFDSVHLSDMNYFLLSNCLTRREHRGEIHKWRHDGGH